MAAKKVKTAPKTSPKQVLATEIANIISTGLAKFKDVLGEKKFDKKIRKAVKLFAQGIKPAAEKKAAPGKAVPAKAKKTVAKIPAKKAAVIPGKKLKK